MRDFLAAGYRATRCYFRDPETGRPILTSVLVLFIDGLYMGDFENMISWNEPGATPLVTFANGVVCLIEDLTSDGHADLITWEGIEAL